MNYLGRLIFLILLFVVVATQVETRTIEERNAREGKISSSF